MDHASNLIRLPVPNTLDALASDVLTTVKEDGTPPYPPEVKPDAGHKQFMQWNVQLLAGQDIMLVAAYEPGKWVIWCRHGQPSDGFFVSYGRTFAAPYLWQQADKALTIPGRQKSITIRSDSGATLDLYIVAVNNVEFWI